MDTISILIKIIWFGTFIGLAALQIFTNRIDVITLLLLGLASLPITWSYIRENVSTIELPSIINVKLLERKVKAQDAKIEQQQDIINRLVIYSMAYYLYEMLSNFYDCEKGIMKEYIYKRNLHENRLTYLRDHGYLEMTFHIRKLEDNANIAQQVKLTPVGRFYVEIRKETKDPTRSVD